MAKIQRVSLERKRELEKPDRILVFLQTTGDYVNQYRQQMIMAAGLIVLVVAVIAATRYFSERSARRGFDGLALIEESLAASPDMAGLVEQRLQYQAFYEKHSGNLAGKIAGLRYADACFEAGDTDAAIEAYRQSVEDFKRQPLFRHLALNGLGYAYEAAGQYDEAARCFQMIVEAPGAADKDRALFNLGRMYDRMGQTEKSRDMFTRIVADYPGSIYAPLARAHVSG